MSDKKRGIKEKKVIWIIILLAFNLFLFSLFVAVTPAENLASAAYPRCLDGDGPLTGTLGYDFINEYKRGIALQYDSSGKVVRQAADYCDTDSNCGFGPDNKTASNCLMEHYCRNGVIGSFGISCYSIKGVCSRGACVRVSAE